MTKDGTGARRRAALVSVYAAVGLVATKLTAGLLTNSLAVLSEAGHSTVDLLAAGISYIAIRGAERPPDVDHHYGHAKFESVGAMIELTFLVVLGGSIVYSAAHRLTSSVTTVVITPPAVVLILATIIVDVWRTVSLRRAARETGSEALAASGVHFLSDLLGTLLVVFGLGMTALGYPRADSIAALLIAVLILFLSVQLGRQVFSSLTDRAPAGLAGDLEPIVRSVPHVIGVHDIRVRKAGSQLFVEMHVDLEPTLPLGEAHDVLDRIEEDLQQRYPSMHVVTHPEPRRPETAAESQAR